MSNDKKSRIFSSDHSAPVAELTALKQVIDTMRFRCMRGAWEREQTHQSLVHYAIEEAYELQEAVMNEDQTEMISELGDVLLQVLFHAMIAENSATFTLSDIAQSLDRKLHQRSALLFSGQELTAAEQDAYWQAQKPPRTATVEQIFAAIKLAGSPWQRTIRVLQYLVSLDFPPAQIPHNLRYPDLLHDDEEIHQIQLGKFMENITLRVSNYGKIPNSQQEWQDILEHH